ncbi:hypothetical protein EJ02DRAFT_459075 [Clathrospora elynae]|uniref:Uncharacterized protein n=1 Tax=Clathrospora elynae TaxID=706981 RepID=A0A6A5SAQ8_9PLEO|nr:hypothetical protein EJ02DRAFT_459075 [Clathrospora elynae]
MEMKKEYAKVTWGVVPEKLGVPVEECKGRFEEIKPKDWKPNTTRKTGGKNGDVQEKNKGRSKAIYVRPATPGQTDWVDPWECRDAFGGDAQVGGATDPWDADCVGKPTEVKNYVCDNNCQNCLDNRCHCSASGSGWDNALCTSEIHGKSPAANSSGDDCWDTSVYGLDNICGRAFEKSIRNGAASLQAKGDCCDAPAQQSQCVGAPNDLRGFGGCPNNVNVNKKDNDLMPAPTTYTVTYWVTIEAGDKSIHIPIDGKNISSPEKTIVEGSAGMKKVWKWVQEKGLGDKVGLQDAFDLAKDMHSEDEGEEWVIDQAQHAVHTSHASSRRSSPSPSDGWPRCS